MRQDGEKRNQKRCDNTRTREERREQKKRTDGKKTRDEIEKKRGETRGDHVLLLMCV